MRLGVLLASSITIALLLWTYPRRAGADDPRFQRMLRLRDDVVARGLGAADLAISIDGLVTQYEILAPPERRVGRPAAAGGRVILACEPAVLARNGRYVLFADGSIQRLRDDALRACLAEMPDLAPEQSERLFAKPR